MSYKYIFNSPIKLVSSDEEGYIFETSFLNRNMLEVVSELVSEGIKDLKEYFSQTGIECLEGKLIDFYNPMIETLLITKEELSKEELNLFTEELSGQFSDGWGEGFEQTPVYVNNHEEFFLSSWFNKNWDIKLILKERI